VVDAAGRLVGVVHTRLSTTRIHFLTPAEEVERLLAGRLLTLLPGQPIAADGGTTLPVTARLADPHGHVRAVSLAVWAGDPGPPRPASVAAPPPQPGDGPERVVPLRLAHDADPVEGQPAEGTAVVPPLPGKKVL